MNALIQKKCSEQPGYLENFARDHLGETKSKNSLADRGGVNPGKLAARQNRDKSRDSSTSSDERAERRPSKILGLTTSIAGSGILKKASGILKKGNKSSRDADGKPSGSVERERGPDDTIIGNANTTKTSKNGMHNKHMHTFSGSTDLGRRNSSDSKATSKKHDTRIDSVSSKKGSVESSTSMNSVESSTVVSNHDAGSFGYGGVSNYNGTKIENREPSSVESIPKSSRSEIVLDKKNSNTESVVPKPEDVSNYGEGVPTRFLYKSESKIEKSVPRSLVDPNVFANLVHLELSGQKISQLNLSGQKICDSSFSHGISNSSYNSLVTSPNLRSLDLSRNYIKKDLSVVVQILEVLLGKYPGQKLLLLNLSRNILRPEAFQSGISSGSKLTTSKPVLELSKPAQAIRKYMEKHGTTTGSSSKIEPSSVIDLRFNADCGDPGFLQFLEDSYNPCSKHGAVSPSKMLLASTADSFKPNPAGEISFKSNANSAGGVGIRLSLWGQMQGAAPSCRDAGLLRSQLEPLPTRELKRRLGLFDATLSADWLADMEREETMGRLLTAYGGKRVVVRPRDYGVKIGSEVVVRLLAQLRRWVGQTVDGTSANSSSACPYSHSTKARERPSVAAENYMILKKPGSGAKQSDGNETISWKTRRAMAKVSKFQELWDLAYEILHSVDPKYAENDFTQLAVTHNFIGSPHIDKQNTGPFYGLSVGNFRNGGIAVENGIEVDALPQENEAEGTTQLFNGKSVFIVDTKERLCKIDGRFVHWVAPYEGERFSLIFYPTEGEWKVPEHPIPSSALKEIYNIGFKGVYNQEYI